MSSTNNKWCNECGLESVGHLHRTGIFIPGCIHDSVHRRLWQLLKDVEVHCACGARVESLDTHPHVSGCPVDQALALIASELKYEKEIQP